MPESQLQSMIDVYQECKGGGWAYVSHIFAVFVLVLCGEGVQESSDSIKVGVTSIASLAAGVGFS